MDAHCEMIMDEYRENRASFEKMRDIVMSTLKDALKKNDILVAVMEARVKKEDSLAGKLELKGYKYNTLSDITDILGARVVTFYSDSVDKISAVVEQMFDIDWENSVDKRKMLDPDRFGYMSLHYICRIPERMYKDPDHPEINEYRFEIQMRTTLQHVWATAYHDTGYKSDVEIPKEYIRALSRLAGMLEIADEQFSQINRELADYRRKVKALVKDGKFDDLDLNGDTFRDYMEMNPFAILNARIAAINNAEIQMSNAMAYLAVLTRFGFKTLGDVERLKNEFSEFAYQLAVLQIGGTDLDIISSNVALQNLITVYILKNGGGEPGIKLMYDLLYGERARNATSAKRITEQAKSINLFSE